MSSNWRLCLCSYLCAQKSYPYTVVKSFTRLAKIVENVKFVGDLQQALRDSLAVFPVSELKSEQKLTIENLVGRRDAFGQLPTGFGKSVSCRHDKGIPFFFKSVTSQLQLRFHDVSIL